MSQLKQGQHVSALMQPGMEVVQKLTQIVGVAYSKLEVGTSCKPLAVAWRQNFRRGRPHHSVEIEAAKEALLCMSAHGCISTPSTEYPYMYGIITKWTNLLGEI